MEAGAIASGTVISSGSLAFLFAGGTVISGGNITEASGASLLGGLTISGGTGVLSGAMAAGQVVSFAGSGGDLALDNLAGFAAAISGLARRDEFDLGGFAFSSSATATRA